MYNFSIGQKKPVHVYQLIAENTVEAKVIDIQEKKKKLVTQVGVKAVYRLIIVKRQFPAIS